MVQLPPAKAFAGGFVFTPSITRDRKDVPASPTAIRTLSTLDQFMPADMPITWLRILDDIVDLARPNHPEHDKVMILSPDAFKARYFVKDGINPADLHPMCQSFHEIGFMSYFPDTEVVDIVVQPQRLIDAIGQAVQPFVREPSSRYHDEVAKYNATGRISRDLLFQLWRTKHKEWQPIGENECPVFCRIMLQLYLMVEDWEWHATAMERTNKKRKRRDLVYRSSETPAQTGQHVWIRGSAFEWWF